MSTPSSMRVKLEPARRLFGSVRLPGDKSISHRYAILGALAEGETVISNYSPSADCESTLSCLAALGVRAVRRGGQVLIQGAGGEAFELPAQPLDAGNSGTTIRLLTGPLASQPFPCSIHGDESLNRRPMRRIIEPLSLMGGRIEARDGEYPPLLIDGAPLKGIRYSPPVASAQVKSCVLLAGLRAKGVTTVCERSPTRDHTERALPEFGVEVVRDGLETSVEGGSRLRAAQVTVPGDFSAAAFFVLGAALAPGSEILIENVGVNSSRTGLLQLVEQSGGDIARLNLRRQNGEPVCDLRVGCNPELLERFPAEIAGAWIPNLIDEIPALAVLGTRLKRGFAVREAAELRKKESDRISAVVSNLVALGLQVDERPDGFFIPPGQTVRGGKVKTFGDHRIAMAFAIACLIAESPIELDDAACSAVSFPGFFEEMRGVLQ